MGATMDQAAIAAAHAEAFGKARPLPLVSGAHPEFSVADGYRIAHLIRDLREARGNGSPGARSGAPIRRSIT